jgi:hypothetical protein
VDIPVHKDQHTFVCRVEGYAWITYSRGRNSQG